MKRFWSYFGPACLAVLMHNAANGIDFHPIKSVEATLPQGGNYFPVENLIQGPGKGFMATAPYTATGQTWVTDACSFPCNYIEEWGQPVLTFDLGQNQPLSEVSIWGYSSGNANGLKDFSLRFASDADGPTGFGKTIKYNPTFNDLDIEPSIRQSFNFSEKVSARYVELLALENFFVAPGDGSEPGSKPGGDRVGFGEIAFALPGEDPPPPPPVQFYPISSIASSTADTDYWPVENLIQGSGAGFSDVQPHQKTDAGPTGNWVTDACGYPCDYLESFDAPVLTLDLGQDRSLNEINVWGYTSTNANGIKEFKLRFATAADGPNGFGTSEKYNPTFSDLPNDDTSRQMFPFSKTLTARYVELTVTDNHFVAPGDGTNTEEPGGTTPGGDRVGIGEIAFPMISVAMAGDFNSNGLLDVADINMLEVQVAGGSNPTAYDLNKDTKVDTGDIGVWVRDLKKTWIGDADLNGQFNSADFVKIFQAGKYDLNEAADWSQGDWNGDLRFNSGDLVSAFQDGGFEAGPRTAVAAVPEPSSAVLSLLAVGSLALARRRR